MASTFKINVILRSGRKTLFDDIEYGKVCSMEKDGVKISIGAEFPSPVTVTPPNPDDPVKSIEYNLYTDIRNYHNVITPDSGRWYINKTQMVTFWDFKEESAINDFKMPLYIFTGQNLNAKMAFGIIGPNYETSFKTLEPKKDRALVVYMRRLSIQIKRGTDLYPIPGDIARKNSDGSITEYLYFSTHSEADSQPWLLTLRDFGEHQKRIYSIPDITTEASMAPLWCSWTDWRSDDVTDEVILRNVQEGIKLGIKNYIIDDGWFGPGLDSDFDVQLNIGDWRADPAKIKDMCKLVQDVKKAGAVPMVWCAPHAVAEGADCFEERKKYLIKDDKGALLLTSNQFHSLCFMCPQSRAVMADICTSFIKEWDFDGAKYDLFNCVPNVPCCNHAHEHDVSSMMEGLHLTLKLIDEKSRQLKKDYIVELKQNYGTPFLSQYGTMTRAGDTPYSTEGNFLRALYVQGYSPYSLNDYQTITSEDSFEATACIVLKMMAVGIPSYSIDFDRLCEDNKAVIRHYNNWYNDNIETFMKYRKPLDGQSNILKIENSDTDFYFLVNNGGNFDLQKSSIILNATFNKDLFVNYDGSKTGTVTVFDCFGHKTDEKEIEFNGWTHLDTLPGCMLRIDIN
ncbi:MAG: alpha-galactosidase [Anaerohalosphaeraceae bacterium]|nr:alpha-galactosidase [Anaerohalosphaeraceae bacterium]